MYMLFKRLSPLLKHRGFAYMELLVVFVFLTAIFAVMIPTYFDYVDKAKLTLARNTVNTIGKALDLYRHKHRTYPARIDFTTGRDTTGLAVFTKSLLEKIESDITSIDSYVGSDSNYTLTVTAADKNQTAISLTPDGSTD